MSIYLNLLVLPLLFLAILPCSATTPDHECINWAHRMLDDRTDACSDLCPQAQRFDKYDYRSGLHGALTSRTGLSDFLRYTGRSSVIGAGADAQGCGLVAVLNTWGDREFASAVEAQSKNAKEHIGRLLDYAGVDQFQERFPRTYALATHRTEN